MIRHYAFCIGAILGLASCASNTTKSGGEGSGVVSVNDFAEVCTTTLKDCRGPGTIELLKEDGSRFSRSWTVNQPVVQGGELVTIFAGETLHLEADVAGDAITTLRPVTEITAPDKTISLTFEQRAGKTDMTLSISNPFSRMLKYRLGMQVLGRDALLKTSSCPIIAKGRSFEHWGHPIVQLVLTDFRLLSDGDAMVCE